MNEAPSERTLERIRKMLALADDQSNPNESATAAAMAATLMSRYNLDRAAVMRESVAAPEVVTSEHASTHDSEVDWGVEPPASSEPVSRTWYRGAAAAWVACAVAGIVIVIGLSVVRGTSPPADDRRMEDAVAQLLGQLDGTTVGAIRAIRAHDPVPNAPRPSDEEIARLMAATNRNLPVQVDEVTWVKNVRATPEAIVYEFEIRDRYVAAAMRQLDSEELKLAIAQSAADMGADVCAPIRQSNRHFRIRSEYVDINSGPINSFSYARGECLASR